MDSEFLQTWLGGFSAGLDALDPDAADALLARCAHACGESFPLPIYRQAAQTALDVDELIRTLSSRFPNTRMEHTAAQQITVVYTRCSCDLYASGVRSPRLCRCSALSLRECWQAALGTTVTIVPRSTILNGGERCVFEVNW
ncbi:MAG: hypothetical protein PHD32_04290 [Eubacteriales bacterium]|nr:hypothetical protein [Eubacteriales bacterium]